MASWASPGTSQEAQASVAGSPAAGAASAQNPEPFCGLVASGRPVVFQFEPVGENRFMTVVAQPQLVPEISVFLLPSFQAAMQHGMGLSVYWCKDGANWQLLGSLSAHKPSDVFRTGWPADPELAQVAAVQVGVAVESLAQIQTSVGHGSNEVGARLQVAKSIAGNLFKYMESFTQRHQANGKEWLILPTDCLSKWIQRFERKLTLDPQFFMKQ